jgi:nitrogen fixation protein FixH
MKRLAAAALMMCVTVACGADEQTAAPHVKTTAGALSIAFASDPNPPQMGHNAVEVVVTDADGTPVTDATVSAVFSMPAMPSMNMPAMRTTADLKAQGAGVYRGTGELSMAGTWSVNVSVTRGGEQVSSRGFSIVAQ